jgi:hypothetical protein
MLERQAFHRAKAGQRNAMSQMVKILLRRSLLTLSAIFVWAKALAGDQESTYPRNLVSV